MVCCVLRVALFNVNVYVMRCGQLTQRVSNFVSGIV